MAYRGVREQAQSNRSYWYDKYANTDGPVGGQTPRVGPISAGALPTRLFAVTAGALAKFTSIPYINTYVRVDVDPSDILN